MNKATITAHGVTVTIEQATPITKEQISDVLSSIAHSPQQTGTICGASLKLPTERTVTILDTSPCERKA